MKTNYRIIAHRYYLLSKKKLIKGNPELEVKIDKQINLIRQHPENLKMRVKYLPPEIEGKIFKVRIGGRKKYRLFYLVDRKIKVVLLIIISTISRKNFDYRKDLPINEFISANEDFLNNKNNEFIEM